eukprot:gene9376-13124_t
MQQWKCPVRVVGAALAPALWGGRQTATYEVTPAGAEEAAGHGMLLHDWVANVGDHVAYVQLLPLTARRPEPLRFLELPPQSKAVLLHAQLHALGPLRARRAVGMPWLRDGAVMRPNVCESELVWYSNAPKAPAPLGTPAAHAELPGLGSLNVAGTVGGAGELRGLQRLGELADCAEFHKLGVLFCVSCGPRLAHKRVPGRPWRVEWSAAGGSPQEGVCVLIHDSVTTSAVLSEHHDVLSVLLPPEPTPSGKRAAPARQVTGCYAVGTPMREGRQAPDSRWPGAMQALGIALSKHRGPKVVLGDFNVRDPAVFETFLDAEHGEGDDAYREFLEVHHLTVAAPALDLPTWLGAGETGVRARRIDHILFNQAAEGLEITTHIAWCLRWTVDHALIYALPRGSDSSLPERNSWRSVAYNTRDPADLLEFTLAAALFSRHCTAWDPVSSFDASLRMAAHAALGRQRTCHVTTSHSAPGADSQKGNCIAEWIAARLQGLPAEHVEIDATHALLPTIDAA